MASEESKVAALNLKHKAMWDTLVQMDPNPSMVQYHKSFKKGYLHLMVFHQKHNSVRVTTSCNSTSNNWITNQISNIKKYKEKSNNSPFWNLSVTLQSIIPYSGVKVISGII